MTNTVKLAITAVLLTITSIFTINALVRQKLPPNPAESCPSTESQYILYTLSACPHCENVHQYLKTNNIADKVKFLKKAPMILRLIRNFWNERQSAAFLKIKLAFLCFGMRLIQNASAAIKQSLIFLPMPPVLHLYLNDYLELQN